jgi:hypothetical protein
MLTFSRKSFGQKAGDAVSGNQNENSGSIVDSVKVRQNVPIDGPS